MHISRASEHARNQNADGSSFTMNFEQSRIIGMSSLVFCRARIPALMQGISICNKQYASLIRDFVRWHSNLVKREWTSEVPPDIYGYVTLWYQTSDLRRLTGKYWLFEFERHDTRFHYKYTMCIENTIQAQTAARETKVDQ